MWTYNESISSDELYHYGVLGMKWGKRKKYTSTSISSYKARKQNEKIDKSFNEWKENDRLKENAIKLGKKSTDAKLAYEKDRKNKALKDEYKKANKDYKKALNKNTEYRKGAIRGEVGKDASRKYLSDAKKVKKDLDKNPNDKNLQKEYNRLMSKHDVERAKARRAPEVGANRMKRKASMKRAMTMTVKGLATTAAIAGGAAITNQILKKNDVRFNGEPIRINSKQLSEYVDIGKKILGVRKYVY